MKQIHKVFLIFLLSQVLLGCAIFNPTSQTTISSTTTSTTSTQTSSSNTALYTESELTIRLRSIFQLSVESGAFEGTYEEWLETVKGPQGDPGREVMLQVAGGYIQWKYSGESSWSNLVELVTLTGLAGQNGSDGTNGIDGREVVFRVAEGYIQWQHESESSWSNLIELAILVGPAGADGSNGMNGADGKEVGFRVSDGYVQWQYVGEDHWNNLIELAGFTGAVGEAGLDGLSAYEIYKRNNPEYTGTEENWIIDLINGNLLPRIVYTVSFDSNGGSVLPNQEVLENKKATKPDDPLRDGYTFLGWYINDEKWSFVGFIVTENITLSARWERSKYNVIYVLNNSQPMIKQIQLAYSELYVPTRIGYSFAGWYINPELTEPYIYSTFTYGDKVLYASWTPNEYQTSFYEVVNIYDSNLNTFLSEGETVTQLALGSGHVAALTSNGRLFMWGNNVFGQIGNGNTANQLFPIDITNVFVIDPNDRIVQVALGGQSSAILTSSGRIFMWGYNGFGGLGDGTIVNRYSPVEITTMFELDCKEKIEQIALGGSFAAALTSKGKLFMWGSNWSGQLGNGTTINSPFPIDITSSFRFQINESIISIKLGDQYSSALTSIGRLHVWGSNQFGQLGDGTQSNLVYPTDITPVFGLSLTERIVELSLGIAHSSIITSNGRMFIWGANWYGQLGNETTKNQSTPIDITNLLGLEDGERIHKISLGNSTLVLTSWGRLLIWGFNMFGEVGDGTTDNRLSPYDVTISLELTNHESILSALTFGSNTFVLTNTMKLIGWGVNWYGQLGNGTLTGSLVPTLIFEPIFEVQLLLQNSRLFPQQVDVPYFSREGYLFNGWYTDLLLTQLFNPDLIMEDSAYLYGEWIPE